MIIFPAIDLKQGQAVRLQQGDMARATVFNADPAAQAKAFEDQGFEYLHIVDLDGAFAGKPVNGEAVDKILKTVSMPVQLGGGIRNMTTIEGGALTFRDESQAKLAEKWRFHGITRLPDGTRDVEVAGGKFNLSDVSARIGLAQLSRLEWFNARRRALAAHYFATLRTDPPCLLPAPANPGEEDGHSWNMFCVLLPLDRIGITRKQFIDAMHARGIGIGVSYEPLHLTSLCRRFGYREGDFPNAERIGRETVTLPLFPAMSEADVTRVCENVADLLRGT